MKPRIRPFSSQTAVSFEDMHKPAVYTQVAAHARQRGVRDRAFSRQGKPVPGVLPDVSVALSRLCRGLAAAEICAQGFGETLFLRGSGRAFRDGTSGLVRFWRRLASILFFLVFSTHFPTKSPVRSPVSVHAHRRPCSLPAAGWKDPSSGVPACYQNRFFIRIPGQDQGPASAPEASSETPQVSTKKIENTACVPGALVAKAPSFRAARLHRTATCVFIRCFNPKRLTPGTFKNAHMLP
ncbi:hypothetical protein [Roseibium sp.]|uniref:hypothetical protein n=1 Tax=Roseibium sp. TaxID=1936156 RepID=UPI003B500EF2